MIRFVLLVVLTQLFVSTAFAQSLPHSCARPDEVAVQHLDLNLTVDFQSKTLAGTATLKLRRADGSKQLMLDTKGLTISKISGPGGDLKFKQGEKKGALGRTLTIELPAGVKEVSIEYKTRPGAEALQWLSLIHI